MERHSKCAVDSLTCAYRPQGNGTFGFTVGINTGSLRTGTIVAAGRRIYVNQAAAGTSVFARLAQRPVS